MKICVVGCGSIGSKHIRNISLVMNKRNISYSIDVFRETRTELSEDIKKLVSKEYYDINELKKYDIVFITNPTSKHLQTLEKFSSMTSCFFIEKPVFSNSKSIDNIKLNKDKKYYVACPLRYIQVIDDVKKIIQNENVVSARAISSSYLPNWRPGKDYRKLYSASKEQGGGVRTDLIHEWDYLTYLFGFPEEIFSLSGKYSNLEIDTEDIAIYMAKYKKMLLELHLDYCGKKTKRILELITNNHNYTVDIQNNILYQDDDILYKYDNDLNHKYISEMEYFFDVYDGKKENFNSIDHAVDVLKITEK